MVSLAPPARADTGAKARFISGLDAALKRRSSTVVLAAERRTSAVSSRARVGGTSAVFSRARWRDERGVHLRRSIPEHFSRFENRFLRCDVRHKEFTAPVARLGGMDAQRTFFITSVTWRRLPIFRKDARARLMIDTMLDYREAGKYLLHEFVVMPDHIHVLLTPDATISLERAVQFIKGGFSYRLGKIEKMEVWQPSFTNHRIHGAEDYEQHRSYIRSNPTRAKLVTELGAYPYSSVSPSFRVDDAPPGAKARMESARVTRR